MHRVLSDSAELARRCQALVNEPYITIDTEFIRERTYYPELCLIQVGGANDSFAIDPLADGIDLNPFYELLFNPNLLKVFHACKQDVEIFFHETGCIPAPLFDTQIAAMACGFGEQASYETLVTRLLSAPLDKSSRFTDWKRRPLTQKQIDYALFDVTYLRNVYEKLLAHLTKKNRSHWVEDEMRALLDPASYQVDPDQAWRRLKFRNKSPRFLAGLQAAARWRELTAQKRNIPRGRLIRDDVITEIPGAHIETIEDLRAMRGIGNQLNSSQYQELFDALMIARAKPTNECPTLPDYRGLEDGKETINDLLKLLLRIRATELGVVPRLLCDSYELEQLSNGARKNLRALDGWRFETFGNEALALLSGRLQFGIDASNGSLIITRAD